MATAVQNAYLYSDLQQRYQGLQALDDARTKVIQTLSHELRNPLTYLTGYIELLLQDELGILNESQRKGQQVVQSKTRVLVRLGEDFTSLEIGGDDWLRVRPVSLPEVARHAIAMADSPAANRHITLELRAPSQMEPIKADPERIGQVLDNLISNAIKFSPTNSKTVVRLQIDGDDALVSVIDQGRGIPKAEQEYIFKRFYQVDSSTRRRSGLGLGLAIVQHIVEAHGGKVWFVSEVGRGSSFHFTLPYRRNYPGVSGGQES